MAAMTESGGAPGEEVSPAAAASAVATDEGDESSWEMNLGKRAIDIAGVYPERSGEPDCSYYMRTGLCRFGATCKFNHPPDRKLAVAAAIIKGEYPRRIGQPDCQYYLKTGTCKFGATCKFHHPREKAGTASRVQFNILGYPLRPNEKECPYYLRTGQCKFGNTCKFHHPQPSNAPVAVRSSYPSTHSTSPGQPSYSGSLASWSLSRGSFLASPQWQGPSSYAQMILPPCFVHVPGWNPYSGQLGSSDEQQRTSGSRLYYMRQSSAGVVGHQGLYSSYLPSSAGVYAVHEENMFPERPDQLECQFYMKTGDCKFGASCKYHHPKDRSTSAPNRSLSPLVLPLRPGEPACTFYSRYGICKYGPSCKFDHPVRTFVYGSHGATSTTRVPMDRRLVQSSSVQLEEQPNNSSGKHRDLPESDSQPMLPGEIDAP